MEGTTTEVCLSTWVVLRMRNQRQALLEALAAWAGITAGSGRCGGWIAGGVGKARRVCVGGRVSRYEIIWGKVSPIFFSSFSFLVTVGDRVCLEI